jgi:hypothetical protein
MGLKLSTGLRNALLDQKAEATNLITATTISFEDGTGTDGRDRIVDSGDGLGSFRRRDKITVKGSTSNDDIYEILAVASGYVEIAAGSLTAEAAGDQVILAGANGGSFCDLFRNCVIKIFTGTQPSDADQGETGTELVKITLNSGAFVASSPANGINFGEVASGVLHKEAGEVWSGVATNDGTAGWFRIYDNNMTTGSSTTAVRMDGAISTTGQQFNMSNTTVTTGGTTTVDSVALTLPAS